MPARSLIPFALCALALGACGGSDSSKKTTPVPPAPSGATGATGSAGKAPSRSGSPSSKRTRRQASRRATPKRSEVGKTKIVRGSQGQVRFILLSFVPKVPDHARSGTRIVGVRLAIQNFGPTLFSVDPPRQVTLIDSSGGRHSYERRAVSGGGLCVGGAVARPQRIAPGQLLQGCLPFAVPSRAKADLLEYRLGRKVASWRL